MMCHVGKNAKQATTLYIVRSNTPKMMLLYGQCWFSEIGGTRKLRNFVPLKNSKVYKTLYDSEYVHDSNEVNAQTLDTPLCTLPCTLFPLFYLCMYPFSITMYPLFIILLRHVPFFRYFT